MPRPRGNPTWSSGGTPSVPEGPSAFEQQVKRLRLKPEQYANSAELREWCLRNMRSHYVPEELLEAGLSIYEVVGLVKPTIGPHLSVGFGKGCQGRPEGVHLDP